MTTCGLHLTRTGLVAVVVDVNGRPRAPRYILRTDEARLELLYLLSDEHEGTTVRNLVVSDSVLALDVIGDWAALRGLTVWTAPEWLLYALAAAAGANQRPRTRATILARLPTISALRPYLRQSFGRTAPSTQLGLFEAP